MVSKNEVYTLDIQNMTTDGNGIAKVDGYTLFVPSAVTGDRVTLKVVKAGKSYGFAKILNIETASPLRTAPECNVFSTCGGCSLMHMNYESQLSLKHASVLDSMQRIGGFKDIEVKPIMPAPSPLGYRNKIQVPVTEINGKPSAGFFAPRSHRVSPAENCLLQSPSCKKVIKCVLEWMEEYSVSAYDEISGTGTIRHIYVREGFTSGEIMVSIVTNTKKLNHSAALAERLCKIRGVVSVIQNINTRKTNVILGDKNVCLYGRDYIYDTLDGIKFKISHNSFFQVNPVMTVPLYQKAIELLGDVSGKTVYDLYCGIGTISLFAARNAKKVIGIEYVPDAVYDAAENAGINKLTNTEFYAGDASEVFAKLFSEGVTAHAAIVDPPRKGLDAKLIDTLLKMNPEKIVYVSCNPATLARDAKILCENGYTPSAVYPFDCFPNTSHVESVVCLSR